MSFCCSVWFSLFLIRICTTYKQATITFSQNPLQLIVISVSNMGLVVLMAVNIKTAILYDVMPFCLVTTVSEKRIFNPLATVKTAVIIFTLILTLHDTAYETVLSNNITHFYRLYCRNSPLVNKVFLAL
jgi:hypothetical protein